MEKQSNLEFELSPESSTSIQTKSTLQRFKEMLTSFGPGVIAVLAWLGAGDLVDSSIAGAHYGYDLMWVLAISLLIRYVIVSMMSRYTLCNVEGLSLVQGFSRLHRFYPYFIGAYALIMGHLFNSYMIKGAAEGLTHLLGFGNTLMWAIVVVAAGFLLIGRSIYNTLENGMKFLLALKTFCLILVAIMATPDVGAIAKGTVGFSIPKDVGVYGAFLMAISLVGAVSGSIANFIYPYGFKEKGWTSPIHLKFQRRDLLFAICVAIILDLAVWVVGAEVLKPNGIQIHSLQDLAQALAVHLGTFGFVVFYLGVIGGLFSSAVAFATVFPKVAIDSLHTANPERKKKYGEKPDNDPLFKWFSMFILITPVIWSIPGMPGFVSLVVFINILSVVGLPVISIGLLILSNQKKALGQYVNKWYENALLVGCTILALWSSIKLAIDFLS
jgi:Mn2+/Fe2+ NRAMP family transporter